jgi:uncharacterized protein
MPLFAFALLLAGFRPPANPTPYRTEEISYANGGITLHASLFVPKAAGRHAAVVILHGSGASDRTNPWTKAYADGLAQRGVIVIYPDKRGSGTSSGDWRTASMEDLAADASAALALLRKRPDVDTARMGVIGFSQGGYIASVLDAQDPNCRFAISISGGTASMLRQTVDEIESDAAAAGITLGDQDRRNILALHEIAFAHAAGRSSWSVYRQTIDSVLRVAPQLGPVAKTFPSDSLDAIWTWIGKVGDFDPMRYWTQVKRPALFVFGGKDARVRIDESIARITESHAPVATNAVILRFQGNAHTLYRDDELDFIVRWIADRGAN